MNSIIEWITEGIQYKYPRGAEEHASLLNEDYDVLEVSNMLGEEIIDMVTYFKTQNSRIVELVNYVKELEKYITVLEGITEKEKTNARKDT